MSYENAPATKLLATHCACCARPLLDAVSVNIGIGPVCREKHGYSEGVTDENRTAANRLISEIAIKQTGFDVVEATRQLRNLGFNKLAGIIAKRLFGVRLSWTDASQTHLALTGPYSEAAVNALRNVPGRKWDAQNKVNVYPYASRNLLWAAIKRAYPGQDLLTQDGAVITIPNEYEAKAA